MAADGVIISSAFIIHLGAVRLVSPVANPNLNAYPSIVEPHRTMAHSKNNPVAPASDQESLDRTGVLAALGAFSFWGVAPIYFKGIQSVPPLEIIAHRVIWAVPLLVVFLWWRDGWDTFKTKMKLPWKQLRVLWFSGVLVGFNWLMFVYAVVSDQVLATSLGYFINPLVNVLLGVIFLSERLNRLRTTAVVLAAIGTTYLGFYLGQPPWLALMLAFSFGFYGLIRKRLGVGPMIGLLWETLLLLPLAIAYLVWSWQRQQLHFLHQDTQTDVLLLLAGMVTILPLLGFNTAAQRLSLTAVGFFQYLAPSISFLLAVLVFNEVFTAGHQVAFGFIWSALILVSVVPVWQRKRQLQRVREPIK